MKEGLDHCYEECLLGLVLRGSHVCTDASEQLVPFLFACRSEVALDKAPH